MGQIIIAVATAVLLPGLPALSYGAGRWTAGMKSRLDDVTWHRLIAILSLIEGVGVFVTLYLLWQRIFFSVVIALIVLVLLIWFQIDWFQKGENAHRRSFANDLKKRQLKRWDKRQ